MKYKKITVIFPGQGSQYTGMGNDFYEQFDFVRDIFDQAGDVLGYDVAHLILKKSRFGIISHKMDLDKTIYTQPAVFLVSYVCYKVLEKHCREAGVDFNPCFLAGHSLGEYTAMAVSGIMDFRTALDLVNKRAACITEFSSAYPDAGLMAIINKNGGLEPEKVNSLCQKFQVYLSIINSPKQIVVGGFKKNLTSLLKQLKNEEMRGVLLNVEGPFHTPLMQPAAEKFMQVLEKCSMKIGLKPVIANVTSSAIVDPEHVRKELYEQIYSHVNWRRSVEKIIADGGDLFIEAGPKTILSNILRDIDPSVRTLHVEDMESLKATVKEIAEQ